MDYHLDRKVTLSTEPEYPSLYRWFLREDDGRGRDQVPWSWSLYFRVTEIMVSSSVSIGGFDAPADNLEAVIEKETIRAKLVPLQLPHQYSCTTYSMFGTDRFLTEIELTIAEIPEGENECCSTWGGVSYTAETDFRNETQPDCLIFQLSLSKDRFARYATLIREKKVDRGTLRVGRVAGFYSGWSPSISTDRVKVLPSGEDGAIEIPEGCSIDPPRLGKVGEFALTLSTEAKIPEPPIEAIDEETEIEEEQFSEPPAPMPASPPVQVVTRSDPQALRLLHSLRFAAWTIAVLLLLILLFAR